VVGDKPLYVYYCKHSGKHALTTDCNLAAAPRRRTDHALVLDTQAHLVKLYTTDGGVKYLRRRWALPSCCLATLGSPGCLGACWVLQQQQQRQLSLPQLPQGEAASYKQRAHAPCHVGAGMVL